MSNLYERIHDLCLKRGITIGKMCADLKISRGNLTELKMNRIKTLKPDNLTKISGYFGVSVDYLLGNEKEPVPKNELDDEMTEILQDFKDSPELRTLFSLSRKATPEQLRQYAKVIKALRGNGDE